MNSGKADFDLTYLINTFSLLIHYESKYYEGNV